MLEILQIMMSIILFLDSEDVQFKILLIKILVMLRMQTEDYVLI